jgi:hypothetical protein
VRCGSQKLTVPKKFEIVLLCEAVFLSGMLVKNST